MQWIKRFSLKHRDINHASQQVQVWVEAHVNQNFDSNNGSASFGTLLGVCTQSHISESELNKNMHIGGLGAPSWGIEMSWMNGAPRQWYCGNARYGARISDADWDKLREAAKP